MVIIFMVIIFLLYLSFEIWIEQLAVNTENQCQKADHALKGWDKM